MAELTEKDVERENDRYEVVKAVARRLAYDNRFLDALKLTTIETHVADCHTCVLHPASHTHRQLSDEQLKAAGIAPDLIRLSIGLEDVEDIIGDLEQALQTANA